MIYTHVSTERSGIYKLSIAVPAIFQTSKQLRAEGLGIFYRKHHFSFHVSCRRGRLQDMILWLYAIGSQMTQNIRYLEVWGNFHRRDTETIGTIHCLLSEEVTTVYLSGYRDGFQALEAIARSFSKRHEGQEPILMGRNPYPFGHAGSLHFLPRKGWFGRRGPLRKINE